MNLLSSIQNQGKVVTEIITMKGGYKKTYHGVLTETIEQGEMTHFDLVDGRTILVNTPNVLFVEVFAEYNNKNTPTQTQSGVGDSGRGGVR
jgi:hypothetical protein